MTTAGANKPEHAILIALTRSLPNLISLGRLLLVPVVLLEIYRLRYGSALLLCAVAGLSDGLDGYLARRWNAKTRLGAYLDPIADKLLLSGVYLTLWLTGAVPTWLAAVVFGRDALMLLALAALFVFTRIRDYPPTVWGKLSTAVQVATALVILLNRATAPLIPETPFLAATLLATLWSAVHYLWIGSILLKSQAGTPPR